MRHMHLLGKHAFRNVATISEDCGIDLILLSARNPALLALSFLFRERHAHYAGPPWRFNDGTADSDTRVTHSVKPHRQ